MCSRLAGPYMKSGESIVLTTDRVMIDDIEYDLILTSQRLALVDSGHTSEEPQVVPFATILSVKGGTTPAREPFITLTVIDPVGLEDSRTIDLIFSQQPYEDRAAECDRWVQKLIENIVSVRQEPAPAGKQAAPVKSRGMNPTVRRFEAPEMPRPHSEVARKSQGPSGELLSAMQKTAWDTQENLPEAPAGQTSSEGVGYPETATPPPAPAAEEEGTTPVPGEPVTGPGSPAESAGAISPPTPGQGNAGPSIRDEDLAKTDERTDQAAVPPTPSEELVPVVTGRGQKDTVPVLPDELTDEKGLQETEKEPLPARTGARARKPAKKKKKTSPAPAKTTAQPESSPEYAYPALSDPDDRGDVSREDPARLPVDNPGQADVPGMSPPGRGEQVGLPDRVVFPVLFPAIPDTIPETPAGQPPAPQPEKIPVMVFAAVAIVLLIIIGAAAITFLYPAGNPTGPVHPVITPTLTPLPVTTIPATVIPLQGVWVKVTYNGTFIGSYGNPGPANQHEVRGTGEQVYPIMNSNDLVQASFTKQDYYGDTLIVEVYNNGTLIKQFKTSAPKGTISILVNSTTGKAPFVPVTTTSE
ncbi:hypothetical protein [Methanoregula sp.]|uniref:hypothetical protein n=2 Tax=Methanoregula sp. TaxID=2052170 RepID=UPI003C74844C